MTISVCVYEECYSLNIYEVSVTVEDEVGNAGVFLLTAVPEGKLRQETNFNTILWKPREARGKKIWLLFSLLFF